MTLRSAAMVEWIPLNQDIHKRSTNEKFWRLDIPFTNPRNGLCELLDVLPGTFVAEWTNESLNFVCDEAPRDSRTTTSRWIFLGSTMSTKFRELEGFRRIELQLTIPKNLFAWILKFLQVSRTREFSSLSFYNLNARDFDSGCSLDSIAPQAHDIMFESLEYLRRFWTVARSQL